MAIRMGLVAARDLGVEELLAAFPMLRNVGPATGNGWTWASFHLFGVAGLAGPKADLALAALGRPALQAWTEDGALWYLAIHAPGRKAVHHVHWFRYNAIASGDDEPETGGSLREFLDEYESDLSAEYRHVGPLPGGGIPAAMAEYLGLRAHAISDALDGCGVPHDRAAVRDAITGRSVTGEEWGWDVGNLPRFLDAIGLGMVFPGWREELEAERRSEQDAGDDGDSDDAAGPEDLDDGSDDAGDDGDDADFDAMIADIGARFSRALAAPHGPELVYQGERSAFRRANMSELQPRAGLTGLFRALYPAHDLGPPRDLREAVRRVDEAMAKCGLAPMGDMVCEVFGEVVIRGYAGEAGDAHGLLYAGTTGQFAYEFNTQFGDGSSHTTSINPGADHPEIKSVHSHFPGSSVEHLFERHRKAITARAESGVRPADHPRDLAVLAARIDDFLARTAA
jgi:hypothetical protein